MAFPGGLGKLNNCSLNETINLTIPLSTSPRFSLPHSSVISWIMVAVFFLTLILNGLLIFAYCANQSLRTSFSIYTNSLACGDFLQTAILGVPNILSSMKIPWPLGKYACGLVIYSAWAMVGFCLNMHLLICLNRLWAVTFSNSYRIHHNSRLALSFVVALIIYVNLWTLPGFCIFTQRYLSEEVFLKRGCSLQGAPDLATWLQCVVTAMYLAPNVLIVVIYPVIYYKVLARQYLRKPRGLVTPVMIYPSTPSKYGIRILYRVGQVTWNNLALPSSQPALNCFSYWLTV